MPLIPLSFLSTFFLVLVIIRFYQSGRIRHYGLFFVLLVICTAQTILLGLYWGYDITFLLPVQATCAMCIPPLSWLSVLSLKQSIKRPQLLRHSIPVLLLMALLLIDTPLGDLIDLMIIVSFLVYGGMLLRVIRSGPDALTTLRLDSSVLSHRTLEWASWSLIASAVVDAIVVLNFIFFDGRYSGGIVSFVSFLSLQLIGVAIALINESNVMTDEAEGSDAMNTTNTQLPKTSEKTPNSLSDEERAEIISQLSSLMKQGVYQDPDLNVSRIARKLGVPAKKVSKAVNQTHGKSISQYVNAHRIDKACELLVETQESVSQIHLTAGFMTKSNFNREFSRLKAMSPTQWRQQHQVER